MEKPLVTKTSLQQMIKQSGGSIESFGTSLVHDCALKYPKIFEVKKLPSESEYYLVVITLKK